MTTAWNKRYIGKLQRQDFENRSFFRFRHQLWNVSSRWSQNCTSIALWFLFDCCRCKYMRKVIVNVFYRTSNDVITCWLSRHYYCDFGMYQWSTSVRTKINGSSLFKFSLYFLNKTWNIARYICVFIFYIINYTNCSFLR